MARSNWRTADAVGLFEIGPDAQFKDFSQFA